MLCARFVAPAILLTALASPSEAGLNPVIIGEPRGVALVGHHGAADPVGQVSFQVVQRFSGVPLVSLPVQLGFGGCGDVRLYSDVVAEGISLDCQNQVATAYTDGQGVARFTLVGGGSGPPIVTGPCATVRVAGYTFPALVVSAFDLDGMNGVSAADGSILAADLFSGQYRARSDFDGDGDVDALDLGFFARALFGGGSPASGSVVCAP
jgi:hypothetical protein